MKTFILAAFMAIATIAFAEEPKKEGGKPDFYAYNTNGTVKIRGVYQTDANGRVIKYTVCDGAGKLCYTEIPYYADDGRIIRSDHIGADGELERVVVYFDTFAKVLDREGKVIDTPGQSFSQQEFLKNQIKKPNQAHDCE